MTRYNITLHALRDTSLELCEGFRTHALTGCDETSKVGTKHDVIKADPMVYLGQFGKQINEDQLFDIMLLGEHYLVKVLKQGTSCTNMDDLHSRPTTTSKTR